MFAGRKAPRTPNFDEADVGDKPEWVRSLPRLNNSRTQTIDDLYELRLESLQAVDEMIGALVDALQSTGTLENTYIFFFSDNGFHLGQHRQVTGKQAPYEEEIRVPLIVRGPGVPEGRVLADHLVGNVDLAPTFAALAGAAAPDFVDGRSLVPLLGSSPPPVSGWRQAFLIMHGEQDDDTEGAWRTNPLLEPPDDVSAKARAAAQAAMPPFAGLRTADYTYVEYDSGERELYDLRNDPYELQNIAATADRALVSRLSSWLAVLSSCQGAACRSADQTPR